MRTTDTYATARTMVSLALALGVGLVLSGCSADQVSGTTSNAVSQPNDQVADGSSGATDTGTDDLHSSAPDASSQGAPAPADAEGAPPAEWAGLGGTGNPTLPDSDEDFSVMSGAYNQIATTSHWSVAVVAQNNTDYTVYTMTAVATATDASGAEVNTSMALGLQPLAVEPGGLAIGNIMITCDDLDGSETIDVAITGDTQGSEDEVDLQPHDVSYDACLTGIVDNVLIIARRSRSQ